MQLSLTQGWFAILASLVALSLGLVFQFITKLIQTRRKMISLKERGLVSWMGFIRSSPLLTPISP
jgi:hypothetical protein